VFDHVGFEYVEGVRVLDDIDLHVKPGETIAIVGPTGAGKTTIINLIPRFYDVTGGRITIDGQDVRDVTLESLRRAVCVVQQDTFLFDASVSNNVAYSEPSAAHARIEDATAVAHLHDYISSLPARYETQIGERGVSLSGGTGRPLGIAAGVLTLAMLRAGLNALGLPPFVNDIATGVILLAVALLEGPELTRRLRSMRRLG